MTLVLLRNSSLLMIIMFFCWNVAHPVQQVYIVHAFKDHAFRWKKPAHHVLPALLYIRRANVGYLVVVEFQFLFHCWTYWCLFMIFRPVKLMLHIHPHQKVWHKSVNWIAQKHNNLGMLTAGFENSLWNLTVNKVGNTGFTRHHILGKIWLVPVPVFLTCFPRRFPQLLVHSTEHLQSVHV